MFTSTRHLHHRITFAVVLYLAIAIVLLTGTLNTLLNRLAQTQVDELGNALSAQLTETLKQPLINDDVISIQVILDNLLADTPLIDRATVYSTSNRILAQSQRPSPAAGVTAPFIRPVSVDNNMIAQLRLELDRGLLMSQYRLPMWVSVALWLLLSIALAGYLIRLASSYSGRIRALVAGLGDNTDREGEELGQLEATLSPFLTDNATPATGDGPAEFAMLAISIPNLPKWRAQLNADHFIGILAEVDALIDNHLALFKGARIHARNGATLLVFESGGGDSPQQRALNCAGALVQLTERLVAERNIPFEIRITMASRRPTLDGSQWYNDLVREECIDRLLDMLPLAGPWEVIVDKTDLDPSQLGECSLEDLSAASVWQFRQFKGERQEVFYGQLEFLTATLR